MLAFLITALLVSLTIGIMLTFLFFPSLKDGAAGPAFRFFAGGGLGIGVTSCLYFVCLLNGLTRYLLAIDLGICLLLLGTPFFIVMGASQFAMSPWPFSCWQPSMRCCH